MAEKSTGTVAEVFAAFLKLGPHIVRRTDRASRLLQGRIRRTAEMARAKAAMPTSSRSASSCRARLPARSASRSASCAATACSAGWRRGSPSPCRRRSFCSPSRSARPLSPARVAEGILHGLKLVAVAVVAQAIWGMANSLTPDRARAAIALAAVAIVVFIGGSFGQIGAIALGAVAGLWLCRGDGSDACGPSRLFGIASARRGRARAVRGRCSWSRRWWRQRPARKGLRCSTRSIVPARWCSAAAMSCCRCCRRRW